MIPPAFQPLCDRRFRQARWGRLAPIQGLPHPVPPRDAPTPSSRSFPSSCPAAPARGLWPLSRETAPKPFMPLPDGETLLAKTARARAGAARCRRARHRHQSRLLLPHQGRVRGACASAEPRDACVPARAVRPQHRARGRAGRAAASRRGTATTRCMLVLPADHLIRDQPPSPPPSRARRALAREGSLVTFGITPTHAGNGFRLHRMRRCARRFAGAPPLSRAAASSRSRRSRRRANTSPPATTSGTPGMFCFTPAAILAAFDAPRAGACSTRCGRCAARSPRERRAMLEIDPATVRRACPTSRSTTR